MIRLSAGQHLRAAIAFVALLTCAAGCRWQLAAGRGRPALRQALLLGTPRFRHASAVVCLIYAGQKVILSGDCDGLIKGFDAATGQELFRLRGHEGTVIGLAADSAGRTALSCGEDGSVRLWDLERRKEVKRFQDAEGAVWSVAFSPDGSWCCSGNAAGTVRCWNLGDDRQVLSFRPHADRISALCWMGSDAIVTASFDGTIRLSEVSRGAALRSLGPQGGPWRGLAISAGSTLAAAGGADGVLHLWELSTGRLLHSADVGSPIQSVAMSGDEVVVAVCEDGSLVRWQFASGELAKRSGAHKDAAWAVAFSPDGKRVVSGGADGTVRLWDTASLRELFPFLDHEHQVVEVRLSADGALCLSESKEGKQCLWDTRTGGRLPLAHWSHQPGTARHVAIADGPTVSLWDISAGRQEWSVQQGLRVLRAASVCADGRLCAAIGDWRVLLLDGRDGRLLGDCESPHGPACVDLSRDGSILAVGNRDGTVSIFHLRP